MLRATPRLRWKSSKRRTPPKASRTTSTSSTVADRLERAGDEHLAVIGAGGLLLAADCSDRYPCPDGHHRAVGRRDLCGRQARLAHARAARHRDQERCASRDGECARTAEGRDPRCQRARHGGGPRGQPALGPARSPQAERGAAGRHRRRRADDRRAARPRGRDDRGLPARERPGRAPRAHAARGRRRGL